MRPIPSEAHAALDVVLGALLIVLPWVFGFDDVTRARGVAVGTGAALIAMSVLTRYDAGLLPVIPMSVHLVVDGLVGVFLLTFALGAVTAGSETTVWVACLVVGLAAVSASVLSDPVATQPSARRRLAG